MFSDTDVGVVSEQGCVYQPDLAVSPSTVPTRCNVPQCECCELFVFPNRRRNITTQKQGDILGPAPFTLYIAAISKIWHSSNTRPLCLFRLTARGKVFAVSDSEYVRWHPHDFTRLQRILADGVPKLMAHFSKWEMEVPYESRSTDTVKNWKQRFFLWQSLPRFIKIILREADQTITLL